MDSPRTPQRTKRYGPSTGVGVHGGVSTFGSGGDALRRRIPVGGLGFEGNSSLGFGASALNLSQNNGLGEVLPEDDTSYDILLDRALEAISQAEKRGSTHVEMEEREWEAWQKWQREQLIEQEVQRRLAMERGKMLAESKRRMVSIPTTSITSPLVSTQASSLGSSSPGPGLLLPEGQFATIGGSASSSPRLAPVRMASPATSVLSRFPDRDVTPPLSPKLAGSFPPDDSIPPLLIPGRSAPPAIPPASSLGRSPAVAGMRDSPLRRLPREPIVAPQPGSSYYPGKHPSLAASRSDIDLLIPDSDTESSVSSYSSGSIPKGRVRHGVGPFR
ncbi:hypothetical protein EX30DRAFT_159910 [Ascodesmis nigricans]|uniref:Uncharacterized protein n=1 Tax=Ascodesmis nigricans TaxID=341454 RepID=A0A4S2MMW3_9PEZI|nr:hypothetical protein EX30DRAFT_159910 [Ascodesmis nigricans]